jgi:pentatricopeptide repeat protein
MRKGFFMDKTPKVKDSSIKRRGFDSSVPTPKAFRLTLFVPLPILSCIFSSDRDPDPVNIIAPFPSPEGEVEKRRNERPMEHPARIVVPTVLISLLLLPLPALFDYIPENHRGYVVAEDRPPQTLTPGFHFRIAGLEPAPAIYPFAPVRLVQTTGVQTREGFVLRIDFSFAVRVTAAGIGTFHTRKGGRGVVEAIRDEAEAALRGAAARLNTRIFFRPDPAPELRSRFDAAMARHGLNVVDLEVEPQNLSVALDIAGRYRRRQLNAAARELLETILSRYPRSPELYITLGGLYGESGDLTRAEEQYLAALYLDLSLHEPMEWLVGYYLHIRDPERAERLLAAGRDRVPESVEYRYWLADIYMLMENVDAAEREILAGLEHHPDNIGLLVNLGAIEMTRENYEEAVAILEPVVAAHPGEANAEFNLGTAFRRLGQYQEALALFHDMENRGHAAPELFNEIARTYRDINNPQLAVDYLQRSLRLSPDQPDAKNLLTEVEQELQP